MSEEAPNPEQEAFLQRVEENIGKIFDQLVENVDQQFTEIEKRMDAQDELIANLFKAYAEMNAALEGTIAEVMSPRTEEEREQFRQDLNRRHADTLRMMHEVGREVERSDTKDPTASILSMAGQESGDPTVWQRSESADSAGEAASDSEDA